MNTTTTPAPATPLELTSEQWTALEWAEANWNAYDGYDDRERGWKWIGDGIGTLLGSNAHGILSRLCGGGGLGLMQWRRDKEGVIEYCIAPAGRCALAARSTPTTGTSAETPGTEQIAAVLTLNAEVERLKAERDTFALDDFMPGVWRINVPGENGRAAFLRSWDADREMIGERDQAVYRLAMLKAASEEFSAYFRERWSSDTTAFNEGDMPRILKIVVRIYDDLEQEYEAVRKDRNTARVTVGDLITANVKANARIARLTGQLRALRAALHVLTDDRAGAEEGDDDAT